MAIASWLRTDSATPNPPGNAVPSPRACTAVSEAMTICADCQRFLAEKVKVSAAPELGTLAGGKLKRAQAGYLSRVEIELADGTIVHGEAAPFPGHPKNPYSDEDLAEKLRENMRPFAGQAATERLVTFLGAMKPDTGVRALTALLAIDAEAAGSQAAAE